MKTLLLSLLAITPFIASPPNARAQRTSANYAILADTVDAAGSRAASANYSNAGSASLIAGVSSIAAPAGMVKSGYLAQLYDVTGLVVNSAAPSVAEAATLQLAAWRLLDDATFLATDPGAVTWAVASGPITDVSAAGLVSAGLVFENTPATVQGTFGGFTGSLIFTVLDSIPDNFGSYAGDGIGDDWQVQYFGQNNPLAAPALDPDGDGATNAFEFTAGLTPTDPASTFHLSFAPFPGQPLRKAIILSPRLDSRNYTVQFRPSLTTGGWQTLTGTTFSDNGTERAVTDPNATGTTKIYRVEITRP